MKTGTKPLAKLECKVIPEFAEAMDNAVRTLGIVRSTGTPFHRSDCIRIACLGWLALSTEDRHKSIRESEVVLKNGNEVFLRALLTRMRQMR